MNKLIPLAVIGAVSYIGRSGRAAGRAAEHRPTQRLVGGPVEVRYELPQLAFYDSMRGLIPVKALSRDPNRPGLIRMKVTAARPGYPRGYEFRARDFQVVPRDRVRRRKFSTRILPYTWVR
jgi:hypothetical protein